MPAHKNEVASWGCVYNSVCCCMRCLSLRALRTVREPEFNREVHGRPRGFPGRGHAQSHRDKHGSSGGARVAKSHVLCMWTVVSVSRWQPPALRPVGTLHLPCTLPQPLAGCEVTVTASPPSGPHLEGSHLSFWRTTVTAGCTPP